MFLPRTRKGLNPLDHSFYPLLFYDTQKLSLYCQGTLFMTLWTLITANRFLTQSVRRLSKYHEKTEKGTRLGVIESDISLSSSIRTYLSIFQVEIEAIERSAQVKATRKY